MSVLEKNIRPFVPKGSHPIDTGRYLIGTNEIKRVLEVVSQWIENRSPGGIIHGKLRLGKSRAINYLMHSLPTKFGEHLPIFLMNCREYKNPKEATFFEDILKDLQHAFAFKGMANVKRDRLFKYFLERAEASGLNRIILFIDDAQRLAEIQYDWLMDIYNELDRYGVSMSAILVGQEELIHQRSTFIKAGKSQILGRFMIHSQAFTGIKKPDDLQTCLIGYDTKAQYPLNSGWTFTRYFFPEAFEEGHRLENSTDELFEVFKDLRQEAGLKGTMEIPMQYLTLTIEYALRHFGANGANSYWLTQNIGKNPYKSLDISNHKYIPK